MRGGDRHAGGGRILRIVHEDAIPVIKHVLLAHGQVYAHGQHGHIFFKQVFDFDGVAQFGPTLQHGEHAAHGELDHEIGFQVKVLGVALQCAEHLQTAEVAQRFGQFKRAVRACQQGQVVEALTLLWIGERGGDAVSPLFLGIAVRIGGAVDRNRFDLMQDG